MRNRAWLTIIVLLICGMMELTLPVSAQETGTTGSVSEGNKPTRPRIAVVPFGNASGVDIGNLTRTLSEEFSTELVNCGRFDVCDRSMTDKILNEQFSGASGIIDPSTAVQIGKIAGVQLIACGSILTANSEIKSTTYNNRINYSTTSNVTVNYKVIDAETGEIWKQETIPGS